MPYGRTCQFYSQDDAKTQFDGKTSDGRIGHPCCRTREVCRASVKIINNGEHRRKIHAKHGKKGLPHKKIWSKKFLLQIFYGKNTPKEIPDKTRASRFVRKFLDYKIGLPQEDRFRNEKRTFFEKKILCGICFPSPYFFGIQSLSFTYLFRTFWAWR